MLLLLLLRGRANTWFGWQTTDFYTGVAVIPRATSAGGLRHQRLEERWQTMKGGDPFPDGGGGGKLPSSPFWTLLVSPNVNLGVQETSKID